MTVIWTSLSNILRGNQGSHIGTDRPKRENTIRPSDLSTGPKQNQIVFVFLFHGMVKTGERIISSDIDIRSTREPATLLKST